MFKFFNIFFHYFFFFFNNIFDLYFLNFYRLFRLSLLIWTVTKYFRNPPLIQSQNPFFVFLTKGTDHKIFQKLNHFSNFTFFFTNFFFNHDFFVFFRFNKNSKKFKMHGKRMPRILWEHFNFQIAARMFKYLYWKLSGKVGKY